MLAPQTVAAEAHAAHRYCRGHGRRREADAPVVGRVDRRGTAQPARWSRWLPIAAAVQGIAIAGLLAALWSQSQSR